MSASSMDGTESVDRAALAGMLKGYDADQLVEEVLSAWDELSTKNGDCLLYTSPSPRDVEESRMPSSA